MLRFKPVSRVVPFGMSGCPPGQLGFMAQKSRGKYFAARSLPDGRLPEERNAGFLAGSPHFVVERSQRKVAPQSQFEVSSIVHGQPGLASRCHKRRRSRRAQFKECGKTLDIVDVRGNDLRGGPPLSFRRDQSVRNFVVPEVGDDSNRSGLQKVKRAEGQPWRGHLARCRESVPLSSERGQDAHAPAGETPALPKELATLFCKPQQIPEGVTTVD